MLKRISLHSLIYCEIDNIVKEPVDPAFVYFNANDSVNIVVNKGTGFRSH